MHRYRNAIFGLIPFAMAMNVNPVHATEECTLSKLTTIELSYDAGGRPIIPVTLDSFERYLLIDTAGLRVPSTAGRPKRSDFVEGAQLHG